jgi:hypothetical protein
MKRLSLISLLALATLTQTFGQKPKCKGNSGLVGACYSVHARATFGNGTPALRLWPIGTKRMLGVTAGPIADDADDPICPDNMSKFTTDVTAIYGDFEICPFTPERKGEMQMVCVESASHLVVKHVPPSKR